MTQTPLPLEPERVVVEIPAGWATWTDDQGVTQRREIRSYCLDLAKPAFHLLTLLELEGGRPTPLGA